MTLAEMRIYVGRANEIQAEREDAANAGTSAPEYREDGYGPPSREMLDAIPKRES